MEGLFLLGQYVAVLENALIQGMENQNLYGVGSWAIWLAQLRLTLKSLLLTSVNEGFGFR